MARRDAEATRDLLIATAMQAMRELDIADLITAIGTREIARRAGLAPTTLFHHFGSVDGLAEAVLARVYDPGVAPLGLINTKVEDLRSATRSASAGVDLHRSEFHRLNDDPEHRLRIGLWAFGGDRARTTYGDYIRQFDATLQRRFAELLASWDREPRPPFDVETLLAAHTALVTGWVVRHVIDPSTADPDRFALAATALTMVMVRASGDNHIIEDRLSEIDSFPVRESAARSVSERRRQTRRRVLDAARVVFDRVGYDRATIADVGREAFVAPTTIYGMVEGKADLAVTLLTDEVETLGPPPDDVDAALDQVAAFVSARSAYLAPYAARLATSSSGDALVAWMSGVVAPSSHPDDAGQGDAGTLAHSLVLVLVSRVLIAPAAGPEGAAAHVRALLPR